MKRAVLADTGPLFAAADPDDALHGRAQDELDRLARENRGILIAYPVLLEAYNLVLHRLAKTDAAAWLREVGDGTLINPETEDYRQAIARVRSYPDQSITLVDGVVAVLASRFGLDVWTYDHHFDALRVGVWR